MLPLKFSTQLATLLMTSDITIVVFMLNYVPIDILIDIACVIEYWLVPSVYALSALHNYNEWYY